MTSHNFFSPKHPRAALVVTVAAVALALSGCNTGGGPGATDTTSPAVSQTPSATPTPTPTATPAYVPASASGRAQNVPVPVLPEVAKTETKEGLEAFVAYWYATLSYAYETGDTQKLGELSGPSCVFCAGLKEGVTAAWSDGRWISGGKIETPAVSAEVVSGKPSYATVQVLQEAVEIRKPDGSLYQDPTKATNTGSRTDATFGASGWIMSDLGLIR
ncbi:hypothetical protein GCM10009712_12760 [Pseudarthrobacter sulfonivorans]|uniref:DUF6318 family protein n=1 Tax=Pseudarthrobacter sulfonivorans TaxID=121292 RepID=UPI00168BB6C2|nr:DUF6318 family protein [Pseudarthrobacter sulfonivorans]